MALDPMTLYAMGAGVSALGGILGNVFSSGSREDALNASRQAMNELLNIGVPPNLAREIILEKYQQVGSYIPEFEQEIALMEPDVAQIQEDPSLRQAQMGGLELLKERMKTGFNAQDRAALTQMQLQQGRDTEAKLQQIKQNFQQRGLGGAGPELAAQLQAASAGSAQAGEEGLKLQAQAARSALEAALQSGQLGTQIRGQEFDIARTKAGAKDQAAMARFNAALGRQERNVGATNLARQQNLATAQRLSEQNVAQGNRELYRQREAEDRVYGYDLERARLRAQGYQGLAATHLGQAQQTSGAWTGGLGAVGQGFTLAGVAQSGQPNKKTT
jgi:hypothetical protein